MKDSNLPLIHRCATASAELHHTAVLFSAFYYVIIIAYLQLGVAIPRILLWVMKGSNLQRNLLLQQNLSASSLLSILCQHFTCYWRTFLFRACNPPYVWEFHPHDFLLSQIIYSFLVKIAFLKFVHSE